MVVAVLQAENPAQVIVEKPNGFTLISLQHTASHSDHSNPFASATDLQTTAPHSTQSHSGRHSICQSQNHTTTQSHSMSFLALPLAPLLSGLWLSFSFPICFRRWRRRRWGWGRGRWRTIRFTTWWITSWRWRWWWGAAAAAAATAVRVRVWWTAVATGTFSIWPVKQYGPNSQEVYWQTDNSRQIQ